MDNELKAPYRPRVGSYRAERANGREPLSGWALFGIIVAGIVAAGVLSWLVAMLGLGALLSSFSKDMRSISSSAGQTPTAIQRVEAVEAPRYRTEVVQVTGRSVEECMALTRGIVNETFARCRSGYSERRTVRY